MGLLPGTQPIGTLNYDIIRRTVQALSKAGIGREAGIGDDGKSSRRRLSLRRQPWSRSPLCSNLCRAHLAAGGSLSLLIAAEAARTDRPKAVGGTLIKHASLQQPMETVPQ